MTADTLSTLPAANTTANPLLNELGEDVMGFLNEIQLKYPAAISFASGRPNEHYFGVQDFPLHFNRFVEMMAARDQRTPEEIMGWLGQYNRAKGIINKEVAKYLEKDEQITAQPEDMLITVGTQEALAIAVMTLCDREKDVIVVEDPTYVGITHFAIIAGYETAPVRMNGGGIDLQLLEEKIGQYRQQGKNVKLVYVIPDYQNPTGNAMPDDHRRALLAMAEKYDFLILEDNAYGEFSYDDGGLPPMKAMDTQQRVVYLRSFAKTLYPSLRLAVMVAGQQVMQQGKPVPLSDLMAKTKGYTTVNTSTMNQAVLGGLLLAHDYSLKAVNAAKVEDLKEKRDQLLASLAEYLHPDTHPGISWNIPRGGFFITIKLPFTVTGQDVITCTEQYGIIFTPMSFFYYGGAGGEQEIRLAFSNVSAAQINTGISRLAKYLESRTANLHPKK